MATDNQANAEPLAAANRCPYIGLGQEFHPFLPPYLDNPYPFFARSRSEEPVFYHPDLDCWVIRRYEDWTRPHDCGHIQEAILPHLSGDDVGLEPVCSQAMLRLTLRRHSA